MKNLLFVFTLLGSFFCSACQQAPPADPATDSAMKEHQMEKMAIEAVKSFYDHWNQGHLDECAKLIATDAIDHIGGQDVVGVDSIMEAIKAFYSAFPDSHLDLEKITASGNLVMAYGTWTGTQKGDFGPFKATNKMYSMKDVDILTVNAEGKLTEHWAVQDGCAMAAQLGWGQ